MRANHDIGSRPEGGFTLQYAAGELRADPEVVLKAVLMNDTVRQFAAKELRADLEVVLEAG